MSRPTSRVSRNLEYLADEPHQIYIVWRDDESLYVGMTANWRARTSVHLRTYFTDTFGATHLDVWFAAANRWEAEQIEYDTIRALDPAHNSEHSPSRQRAREIRDIEDEICRRYAALPIWVTEPEVWADAQAAMRRAIGAVA